jgi:hypothetical protein
MLCDAWQLNPILNIVGLSGRQDNNAVVPASQFDVFGKDIELVFAGILI